jgi:quinoprotein glucose dehydrogenase
MPEYRTLPAAKDSELTPALPVNNPYITWERSQADSSNTRFSGLTQINRHNVARLQVAWTYHSKDGKGNIQANPLVADGVMYGPTVGNDIVAIDAQSGTELWRFKIPLPSDKILVPAQRGMVYERQTADHEARIYFSASGYLFALDAKTGKAIVSFGKGGAAPASQNPGQPTVGVIAPVIYKNTIIAANQTAVDAYDLESGSSVWSFNTVTYPVADSGSDSGANIWGGIALDEVRGIVFAAVGDPHPNFVGIDRRGDNKYSDSTVALDARTGKLLWSFQDIAHGLWDLDVSAPPVLVTVTHGGRRVDAVAQVNKLGNTLLLDRLTGKPLFPYRMRRAPVSTVPGEFTWPYQPALELPEPFSRQVFTLEDATDIDPASHAFVLRQLEGVNFGWFVPPAINKPVVFYGIHGGSEWPGAAFDPTTGRLYIAANQIPFEIELIKERGGADQREANESTPGYRMFQNKCAPCHGKDRQGAGSAPSLVGIGQRKTPAEVQEILQNGRGGMPPFPSLSEQERDDILKFLFADTGGTAQDGEETLGFKGFNRFLDDKGYPASRPPWGTLNAIDLNTGRRLWQVPLGEDEELTRKGIPKTGTENFGGATVTAGGLVFCAGTRDLKIRAFDKDTGQELWQAKLPYGGYAPPATYEVNGRQYVVVAATGGGKLEGEMGDAYVAFALPKASR